MHCARKHTFWYCASTWSTPCRLLTPGGTVSCPLTGTGPAAGRELAGCALDADVRTLAADVWEDAHGMKPQQLLRRRRLTCDGKRQRQHLRQEASCNCRAPCSCFQHAAGPQHSRGFTTASTERTAAPRVCWRHGKLCCSRTAAVWSARSRVLRFARALCASTLVHYCLMQRTYAQFCAYFLLRKQRLAVRLNSCGRR
jgi:hypothetical protein